nr:uncharacterized protein LOC127306768 isoform X2 [Lolium perenne]
MPSPFPFQSKSFLRVASSLLQSSLAQGNAKSFIHLERCLDDARKKQTDSRKRRKSTKIPYTEIHIWTLLSTAAVPTHSSGITNIYSLIQMQTRYTAESLD